MSARMPFSRNIPKYGRQSFIFPQPDIRHRCARSASMMLTLPQPGRAGRLPLSQAAGSRALQVLKTEARHTRKIHPVTSQAEKCFPFSVTPKNS